MRKVVLFSVFSATFFFACGTADEKVNADSAVQKKGITVSDQQDLDPHIAHAGDSIFNGEYIDRYDNGVIYMKGEFSGGLRHGEWISFYKSGKEWSRGTYKAGFREGYGVSYYENGQKSSEGNYKKDKKVGKWKFWNEQGQMVEKDLGGE